MKYFWIIFFCCRLVLALPNLPVASGAVFNQVLFAEGNQSWTTRDFKLYKKIVLLVTKSEKISAFSNTAVDDFLLSRLLKREALLFEIAPQKLVLPALNKSELGEFTKSEVEQELIMISEALALLELKKSQMSQKIRFQAWIDVLKRKYAVKIKSHET